MATFPRVTPTYQGFSKKSAPAVRTVRFADGFEQRIFFGLASNQNPKVYNVSFELSETESDVMVCGFFHPNLRRALLVDR